MQSIRLYLVRHGHVQYFDLTHQPINPKYALLSDQGVQQIQLLAEHLKAISLDQIFLQPCHVRYRPLKFWQLIKHSK